MSIVLHGFGQGTIDSGSTLVAFGLVRDLDVGESIESAVASAGIENLFVVDFSYGRRNPSAAEYRRYKRLLAMMQAGQVQFRERKGKRGGIEYYVVREPILRKAA